MRALASGDYISARIGKQKPQYFSIRSMVEVVRCDNYDTYVSVSLALSELLTTIHE